MFVKSKLYNDTYVASRATAPHSPLPVPAVGLLVVAVVVKGGVSVQGDVGDCLPTF